MNLLENSMKMQKIREDLFNLLNSTDESIVAVGVSILWDLVIPDDLVFFLFEKSYRSPSIASLLLKYFPEEEFESAHIWFSLHEDYQRAKNFCHLPKIPKLHKEFSWKRLLKSFILPVDYPYFRGGTAAHFEQKLFNSPYIPKEELIPFRIDKRNILTIDVIRLPPEVGNFSEIKGIITEGVIYDLPYTILKLNNVHFLDLGRHENVGKRELNMLKIGNKSFVEVAKKFNPQMLVNLELSCWIERNKYNKFNNEKKKEDIKPFLQEMQADAKLFKLVQAIECVRNDLENEALNLLIELYEQDSLYETSIGSSFEYMLMPFKGSPMCSYFIISQFQNHNYESRFVDVYIQDIFTYYFEYLSRNHCEYACKLAYKTSTQTFIKDYQVDMFFLLSLHAYLKMNHKTVLQMVFMEDFKSNFSFNVYEIFATHKKGLITTNELFNQVQDIFINLHRKNPHSIKNFINKYKNCLPLYET
ncbi:MAG: hypothetical protein EAZ55_07550 [Cytophagales bacterium]|nr:MAG: hypothetical protein EAZ55_07550 [Cytophagales bacterium]